MRLVRAGLLGSLVLFVLAGFGLGLLYLRLSSGPMSVGPLAERLEVSLAHRIGPGWNVALRDSTLKLHNGALALQAAGLDIRDPEGALVLRTPQALVSVDTLSLLTAQVQPRAMEFRDLQLRAVLNSNGALSFSPVVEATDDAGPAGPVARPRPRPARPRRPRVRPRSPSRSRPCSSFSSDRRGSSAPSTRPSSPTPVLRSWIPRGASARPSGA
jgi:hypothetical protein